MIRVLFTLLMAEVGVVVVLLFKTPLRKLAVMGLDRLKRGRGPVMLKTVAGTMLLMLSSSVYSMARIKNRSTDIGGLTPTEQVLMSFHILEASLMGYSLLLALIIDRLHHYIRELRGLRKSLEAVMKQNRALEESKSGGSDEMKARDIEISKLNQQINQLKAENAVQLTVTKQNRALEESKSGGSDEIKARDEEIAKLNQQINQLKAKNEEKLKELKAADANMTALRKQSEGFLIEYDRLLEDNQNLRNQLHSIDLTLSHSDSKKHP
ncbi:B-cell receptor-associated protein 31-like isoform X2 [Phalaenopsis equestris]|uniref:B-cell receptor-associated protein 31-like isoform X1 n=1 Tax=Phalaenopsis equestris TaxID=78828 RepID=UPI0009E5FC3B|nr:B-cell receptor-associated protein 31-like isoform X1 [Phalaenopsis equestris]XP_020592399.1 B-cell receptor-associated protein 31-like isoform X2 [Phalaenopsis equestris]